MGKTLRILGIATALCILPLRTEAEDAPSRVSLIHIVLGWVRERLGDHDGAIAEFTRALQTQPRLEIVYEFRGYAKARKGDLDGAVADLTRAAELDSRRPRPLYMLGDVKAEMGDREGAIADYSRAILRGFSGGTIYGKRAALRLDDARPGRGARRLLAGDPDPAA